MFRRVRKWFKQDECTSGNQGGAGKQEEDDKIEPKGIKIYFIKNPKKLAL